MRVRVYLSYFNKKFSYKYWQVRKCPHKYAKLDFDVLAVDKKEDIRFTIKAMYDAFN